MFRGLLSSRLIQVGLVFFVVVVGGSLLYSWQTRRATVAEFTRTVDKQTLMVYPTYPKTAYVTYGYVDLPDGTVHRYIKSIAGGDDLPPLSPEMAFRGEVPSGVNVINKEGAGINPYSFLQLGEKR